MEKSKGNLKIKIKFPIIRSIVNKKNTDISKLDAFSIIHSNDKKSKVTNLHKTSFMQKLLIPHDSKWKSIFDLIVLLLISYSCISILF
jgi:hypothetical protein